MRFKNWRPCRVFAEQKRRHSFLPLTSLAVAAQDAVQKLASVPIFELRVFAEQKRRHGFLPLTSVSACGTGWATKNLPSGFLVATSVARSVNGDKEISR